MTSIRADGNHATTGAETRCALVSHIQAWMTHLVQVNPLVVMGASLCSYCAGVAAGFNAPISGVFFAVETVLQSETNELRRTNADTTPGLTIAMVLLASVLSAIVCSPCWSCHSYWDSGHAVGSCQLALPTPTRCVLLAATILMQHVASDSTAPMCVRPVTLPSLRGGGIRQLLFNKAALHASLC